MTERLSIYAVAKRYNIAVCTLYSWLQRQWIIAPRRLGGRAFWFESDLIEWEAAGFPRPCDTKEVANAPTES